MRIDPTQLKSFIVDTGLVSTADFVKIERDAERKQIDLSDALLSAGALGEDELRRIEAHILGVPFVSLKGKKIRFETLSLIPEPVARTYNVIAYNRTEKGLEVAMLDTGNLPAIEFIKKKVGVPILARLTDSASIKEALIQYQRSLKEEFGDIIKKETDSLVLKTASLGDVDSLDLAKLAEDLPVVRMVDTLIKHAILQNASDIHVEPLETELLVRYRIDGLLHDAMKLPREAAPGITARIKVLARLKLDEKRLPQDGRFKIEMDGDKFSFRVSILPTYLGEKTVMRILKETGQGFTLEGLGFHGEGLELIHWAIKQTTGMILTTGPTGSGKTTTLYTVLDLLNTPDVNISTIEDPVEYQIPRINQTQVKPEIGFTFANGLRTLVRQDPDIIMVGEIRDSETAGLAVQAALTGHLVLSTLHTNNAAGAIPRLIDMDVEKFLIVSTVKIILAQRLVRRLTHKKERYFLSPAQIQELEKNLNLDRIMSVLVKERIISEATTWDKVPFYKPQEGEEESAYEGRIGIHEVMKVSPAIKELIMKDETTDGIHKQALSEGMITMFEDGIIKAVQGITTIEEVLSVIAE